MSDITRILKTMAQGDSASAEQPLPLVEEAMRCLRAAKMVQRPLQATALLHEAWLPFSGGKLKRRNPREGKW